MEPPFDDPNFALFSCLVIPVLVCLLGAIVSGAV